MTDTTNDAVEEARGDITCQDLLEAIENNTSDPTAMPVVVTWPDGEGRENRRVLAVAVGNDGSPEVPTLQLIVGEHYDR